MRLPTSGSGGVGLGLWRRPSAAALAAALVAFVVGLTAFDIHSHDIWWHLTAGEWILEHREVPRVDPFSSTVAGEEWVDHEWLAQVGLVGVERLGGVPGLVLLRVLVVSLLAWLLVRALARRGVAPLPAAGMVALALLAARLRLHVKPELVTLALVTWLVALVLEGGWGKRHLALAALFVPWVNLHGGFLLGLAVLGCHATGGTLDLLLGRSLAGDPPSSSWRDVGLRWTVVGLAAAGTLVNPYGPAIYSVLARIAGTLTGAGIANPEWRAPLLRVQPLFFVLAIVVVATLVWAARRLPSSTLLLGGLLLVYGFRFARGTTFLDLAFPLLVAAAGTAVGSRGRLPAWFVGAHLRHGRAEILGAVLLVLGAAGLALRPGITRFGFGVDDRFEPVHATAFLERERPAGELYNEIGDGGYLMWRLWPEMRVFLDGRMELYTELLADWNAARRDAEAWNRFLAEHDVATAVVRYPPPLPGGARPRPTRALFDPERWALVYFDRRNLVYLRRGAEADEPAARLEYRCLHPELLGELTVRARTDGALTACLESELDRRLAELPVWRPVVPAG